MVLWVCRLLDGLKGFASAAGHASLLRMLSDAMRYLPYNSVYFPMLRKRVNLLQAIVRVHGMELSMLVCGRDASRLTAGQRIRRSDDSVIRSEQEGDMSDSAVGHTMPCVRMRVAAVTERKGWR